MSRGAKRTTIVDVAKEAGVSPKTVSRVTNGEPYVTAEVEARVRAAMAKLDYRPNLFAQSLVRRQSFIIGLIYENPSPSYVVELQLGALDRLEKERYRLFVLPVRSVQANASEIVGLLRSAALEGVILAPPASDHPLILRQLDDAGIRYARVAPTRNVEKGPSVVMDDIAAARAIAQYVIQQGHRRIGIIKGDPTHASSEARLIGYTEAIAAAGLSVQLRWMETGLYTFESGYAAAQRILTQEERPTALLIQNDEMAVGALMAAREAGIAVPDELSIVGFDDSEVSRIAWPRLTTVRQPVYEMAVSAADMLLSALAGNTGNPVVTHDFELMIRDSVVPPPGG